MFALVTRGGTTLGAYELDDDEAQDGAFIRREGEPDRRVVGFIERTAPENFDVLVVERAQSPPDATVVVESRGPGRPQEAAGGPGRGCSIAHCSRRPMPPTPSGLRRVAEPPVGAT